MPRSPPKSWPIPGHIWPNLGQRGSHPRLKWLTSDQSWTEFDREWGDIDRVFRIATKFGLHATNFGRATQVRPLFVLCVPDCVSAHILLEASCKTHEHPQPRCFRCTQTTPQRPGGKRSKHMFHHTRTAGRGRLFRAGFERSWAAFDHIPADVGQIRTDFGPLRSGVNQRLANLTTFRPVGADWSCNTTPSRTCGRRANASQTALNMSSPEQILRRGGGVGMALGGRSPSDAHNSVEGQAVRTQRTSYGDPQSLHALVVQVP